MYIKRWNSIHTLAKHARQTVDFVNVFEPTSTYYIDIHVYVCDTDYNVGIHRYTQLKLY